MARPSLPLPPRVPAPDLPPRLEPAPLGARGDLHGALIEGLTGAVDASHARVTETALRRVDVESLELGGAAFVDVDLDEVRAVTMSCRASRWQTVRMNGGRVATLDVSRSDLSGVEFRGLRIDYLTLAGSTASDVLFVDCTIGSLDAPQSTLSRIAFEGCRVDEVDNRDWRIENVDLRGLEALRYLDMAALRGATLSERQVTSLALAFASAVGVDVRD